MLPGDNGSVARAMRVILELTPPRRRHLDLYVSRSAGKEALREAARAGYRQALVSCATAEVDGAAVNVAAFMRYAHGVWTRETLLGYPPASAVEDRLLRYPGEPFCYGDVGSLRIH